MLHHDVPFPGPWIDFPVTDADRARLARFKDQPITFRITRGQETLAGTGRLRVASVNQKAQAEIQIDRHEGHGRFVQRRINLSEADFREIQEETLEGLFLESSTETVTP
jgi:phage-related minor tail protein